MPKRWWRPGSFDFWSELSLFAIGLASLALSIWSFVGRGFGWFEDRLPGSVLFALGLLIVLVGFDRREMHSSLRRFADAEYLEATAEVFHQLERIVREAKSEVDALGARARASSYLKAIEAAVAEGRVIYHRVLDRDFIYHGLHEHLDAVIGDAERVWISWIPEEKYGHITVTDAGCVIALPSPVEAEVHGLIIHGPEESRSYRQYVRSVWNRGTRITSRNGLRALCQECSRSTAGDASAIRAAIQR